ncbi:MAG TPA: serine/threonine-protein kinase [Planctomycetaceae bacterium]|nr:serine/threonine-protein kinase [Planctomycetaceae bacterium]
MAANPKLEQLNRKFSARLDQFESEWLDGTPPDIASYLRDSASASVQDLSDLIELDLEYRWKQFSIVKQDSARADREFPQFPLLEDYVALLPEQRREELLVPQLIAEEYRVRSRWGDRPDKQSFADRFPHDRAALEAALEEIDKEFESEEISPHSEDSSQSMLDHSTLIYSRGPSDIKADSPIGVTGWTTFGKYQLEIPLGRGAFGEVWRAYDPHLKRHVAIKFPRKDRHFPPEMLESFQREAQKLATLGRIPGIVTVFDFGEQDGQPYFVSDFIEGESLAQRMEREKFSIEESAELVAKVAETLKRAHKLKLVHRDIKPANILLDADGEPYLADFGLAITDAEQLTEGRSIVGTFAYMSPEQASGESHRVDGRADIFALGVLLYRLLTGELPFRGQNSAQCIDHILHQKPRPPRQIDETIPAELERICLKCLKKEMEERYSSAGELARDLQFWRQTKRRQRGIQIAALVAIVLAAAIALRPTPEPQDLKLAGTSDSNGGFQGSHELRNNGESLIQDRDPDLLGREPEKLLFNHFRNTNHSVWHSDTHQLQIQSPDPAILSCGERTIGNGTISVRVENHGVNTFFGVFWGYRKQNNLDDQTKYRARCVYLDVNDIVENHHIVYCTFHLTYEPGHGLTLAEKIDIHQRIPLREPLRKDWLMTLDFVNARLDEIQIDGSPYFITEPTRDEDRDFTDGQLGIYAHSANLVVRNFISTGVH